MVSTRILVIKNYDYPHEALLHVPNVYDVVEQEPTSAEKNFSQIVEHRWRRDLTIRRISIVKSPMLTGLWDNRPFNVELWKIWRRPQIWMEFIYLFT
jgi:hypothetical protein